MKLYIDTSSNQQTIVKLDDKELVESSREHHSQAVLPMIEKLLIEKHKKVSDVTEIKVNIGPGSFTGLRVGVSIANALGYALKVPVNGSKIWEMEIVEPIYEN